MKIHNIFLSLLVMVAIASLTWSCVGDEEEVAVVKTSSTASIDFTTSLSYIYGGTNELKLGIGPLGKSKVSDIESVEISKTFISKAKEDTVVVGFRTITTLPDTISLTLDELLAETGYTADELGASDTWTFKYKVNHRDKSVLTPAKTTIVTYTCLSDLAGTYNYSTIVTGNVRTCENPITGNGTLTATSTGGVYTISDASFGQFKCAWDVNAATGISFTDICETIAFEGTDQYGLSYELEIVSNDGTNMIINWWNNDGDAGTTTLTRTDTKTWPLGLKD